MAFQPLTQLSNQPNNTGFKPLSTGMSTNPGYIAPKPSLKQVQVPEKGFNIGDTISNIGKTINNFINPQSTAAPIQLPSGLKLNLTPPTKSVSSVTGATTTNIQPQVSLSTLTDFTPGQKQLTQSQLMQIPAPPAVPKTSKNQISKLPASEIGASTIKTLNELRVDPLSFKANPANAISDWWKGVSDSITAAGHDLRAVFTSDTKTPPATTQRIGSGLKAAPEIVGAVLSPITSLFSAANDIPIIGSLSKIISLPFEAVGDTGKVAAYPLVDSLPISKQAKDTIVSGIGDIISLAGQIAIGGELGKLGEGVKAELVSKYGKADANTIISKATDIAQQKIEEKTLVPGEYTPEEVINHVINNNLAPTPEGKQLMKTVVEAQKQGLNIEVTKPGQLSLNFDDIKSIKTEGDTMLNPIADQLSSFVSEARSGKGDGNISVKALTNLVYSKDLTDFTEQVKGLSTKFDNEFTKIYNEIKSGEITEQHYANFKTESSNIQTAQNTSVQAQSSEGQTNINGRSVENQPNRTVNTSGAQIETTTNTGKGSQITQRTEGVGENIRGKPESTSPTETVRSGSTGNGKPESISNTARNGEALKVSKIAKEIDAKAVEKKITEGFSKLAGYDPTTVKEQARLSTELINSNIENARAIVRNEKTLPKGINGAYFVKAMEDYLEKNPDPQILSELAKSHLVSGTSQAAQTLRMAAERDPYAPLSIIKQLEDDKRAIIEKRLGKSVNQAVKDEVGNITKEIKKAQAKRADWASFIKGIQC